jgi:glycosyltransferase involved in cell wall biosynthesis
MINDLKVAIWMVTYNHALFIEQALDSILSQKTDFKFKLFIGEDFSTDGTREICIKYAEKYPDKIDLSIREKNVGIFVNAISIYDQCKKSGAEFVALCEGDDFWIDNYKLQKQVDFLNRNQGYSSCFHNTFEIEANEKLTYNIKSIWKRNISNKIYLEDLLRNKYSLFHTSSLLYRNELFETPEWFSKNKGGSGDLVLFFILAEKDAIGRVKGVSSVYRKHENSLTNISNSNEKFLSERLLFLDLINCHFEFRYSKLIERIKIEFKEVGLVPNNNLLYRIKTAIEYRYTNYVLKKELESQSFE